MAISWGTQRGTQCICAFVCVGILCADLHSPLPLSFQVLIMHDVNVKFGISLISEIIITVSNLYTSFSKYYGKLESNSLKIL